MGQVITSVSWIVQSPNGSLMSYIGSHGTDLNLILDTAGIWTITITIESNKGCSQSFTNSITVHETPLANYTIIPDSSCLGNGLTYFNASSSLNGSGVINQYLWDFSTNAIPSTASGINLSLIHI